MIFPAKPSAVAGRFDIRAKVGGGLSGIGLGCGLLLGVLVALASPVRAAAQTLLAFGVDGIITNNPGLIWKAVATRPQP